MLRFPWPNVKYQRFSGCPLLHVVISICLEVLSLFAYAFRRFLVEFFQPFPFLCLARAQSQTGEDDRRSVCVQPQGRGPHLQDLPGQHKVSQPDILSSAPGHAIVSMLWFMVKGLRRALCPGLGDFSDDLKCNRT